MGMIKKEIDKFFKLVQLECNNKFEKFLSDLNDEYNKDSIFSKKHTIKMTKENKEFLYEFWIRTRNTVLIEGKY